MPTAKDCEPYIMLPLFLAFFFVTIGYIFDNWLSMTFSIGFMFLTFSMAIFFRDPELVISDGIVSPANGKVQSVNEIRGNLEIKIFMNVWNIHVNRSPIDGTVVSLIHKSGSHRPAYHKDADSNEHLITDLETSIGRVRIVQIAGSFARRIHSYIKEDQQVEKGERIGIIRFGSRVDLQLPKAQVRAVVEKGNIVKPGQTIAEIKVSYKDGVDIDYDRTSEDNNGDDNTDNDNTYENDSEVYSNNEDDNDEDDNDEDDNDEDDNTDNDNTYENDNEVYSNNEDDNDEDDIPRNERQMVKV